MTACSNCGAANEHGRKFCKDCGSRLVLACSNCGAANAPDARFCGECGDPLATPPAASPRGAGTGPGGVIGSGPAQAVAGVGRSGTSTHTVGTVSGAERRIVSVLFADLVGFTPFAEDRDPEEVRDTLTRYFDLARDVIARYGGTVEKFIGDAVMAVWGAPIATENDAERAVRAALELVAAVPALAPGIEARAGVLTGEAAVTIGATNQGMVAGDLVNTASRLQSAAPPGTVLVGEATHRSASGAIAFEEAGLQQLKGRTAPVAAWRAVRVVAERGGRNRSEGLEAPFVGRDEELRQLKDLFHATSRERRARLVSVAGPAGIGKSRLAWEFLKYIDGLLEAVWWHDGRSPSYGDGISFWALGEMVRGRAGLLETDDAATTRTRIAATVAEHVPAEDERRWIERALLVLLGIETGMSPEQLFPAWRMFFERLAATAPVAMVFEDLHWADGGTLDFIDHLLEWSRNAPIYVLTLARPELLERRPDWGAGKRNFTSLFLEPLPERSMRALLAGLVPGLPESAVAAVLARADGMPLYAVETVRMLVADGRLELSGNQYVPVGDLTKLAVPETLTALIAARLDGLAPRDRALVQDAAVLGQSFTLAGLSAVTGIEEWALQEQLRVLVRRELLTLEADPRSPERGQYSFVQALIREVAYNTLGRRDRRVRHLAAARFFERLGNDELVGALAGQYLAAHANATEQAEAAALAAQARLALRAAATRAASLQSHDQAVAFLSQALTVTTHPPEAAELLEPAARSAIRGGHPDQAEAFARRAIEIRRALGDRSGAARCSAILGEALLERYLSDTAHDLLVDASAEFSDLGDDPDRAALDGQLARSWFFKGNNEQSVVVADRVLSTAEHADLKALVADTLVTKGSALTNLARPVEGLALIRSALELAERAGLVATAGRAYTNVTFFLGSHDPREGLAYGEKGLAYARRMGLGSDVIGILENCAFAAFRVGDWAWADELWPSLVATTVPEARAFLIEAVVLYGLLRGERVDAELAELRTTAAASQDRQVAAAGLFAQGVQALVSGDPRAAHEAWLQTSAVNVAIAPMALTFAGRAGIWARDRDLVAEASDRLAAIGLHGPAVEADRRALEAALLALDGRQPEALALYTDVLDDYDALGLTGDVAFTQLEMAAILDPLEPQVAAAAHAARDTFSRLGARPLVARIDALLASRGDDERTTEPARWASRQSPAEAPEGSVRL